MWPASRPCGRTSSTTITAANTKASRNTRISGGRKVCSSTDAAPDQKTAERRARQAAEAAHDGADEGDVDEVDAHARLHQPGLRHEQHGHDGRQEAADREGERDHPVGPDAEQARHAEILGRGPHLEAEPRRAQEPGERAEQHGAGGDDDELQDGQARPEHGHLLLQTRQQVDAFRARVDEQDQGLLDEDADREGGDEQRGGVAVAQRPHGDALRQQGEHHAHRHRGRDRPADRYGRRRQQRVAGERDEVAMGEIDEPHDAEHQADAERRQRVEAAEAQRVGDDLGHVGGHARASASACVEAEIGGLEAGVVPQVGAGTAQADRPAVQHENAIRGGERARGRLLHHQHGGAAVPDGGDEPVDVVDHQRREAERGLVQQQQDRPAQKGAGDHELLLLAARQLAGGLRPSPAEDGEHGEEALDVASTRRRPGARVAPSRRFSSTVSRAKT